MPPIIHPPRGRPYSNPSMGVILFPLPGEWDRTARKRENVKPAKKRENTEHYQYSRLTGEAIYRFATSMIQR